MSRWYGRFGFAYLLTLLVIASLMVSSWQHNVVPMILGYILSMLLIFYTIGCYMVDVYG